MTDDIKYDYIAYTDGSCNNLSPYGEGGAAYIILDSNHNIVKKSSKGFIGTTNNRMELIAIMSALASIPAGSTALIYTDSQYCIMMLGERKSPIKKKAKNLDLISKSIFYKDRLSRVDFKWVKGHNGNEYNELADALAASRTEEMRLIHGIPEYNRLNSPKIKKP